MKNTFRGLPIYEDEYPTVLLKGHPVSRVQGHAAVHRIVAYEKYGELPDDKVVHHIDGDRWNWSPDNLALIDRADHATLHHRLNGNDGPINLCCDVCGDEFEAKGSEKTRRKHCSVECRAKSMERINWPPVEELVAWVKDIGYSALGRRLGVSDNAIRKRIRNHTGEHDSPRRRSIGD